VDLIIPGIPFLSTVHAAWLKRGFWGAKLRTLSARHQCHFRYRFRMHASATFRCTVCSTWHEPALQIRCSLYIHYSCKLRHTGFQHPAQCSLSTRLGSSAPWTSEEASLYYAVTRPRVASSLANWRGDGLRPNLPNGETLGNLRSFPAK
jgi:hypothetical protein